MAHLKKVNDRFYVRFRYEGRAYNKALKTKDEVDAKGAYHGVERTLHRLKTGCLKIPAGVDPGDFVVSGGTHTQKRRRSPALPSISAAFDEYLASQENLIADSYLSSQRTHLNHLKRFLDGKAKLPVTRLTSLHLTGFMQSRLKLVDSSTVTRERNTLKQFGQWTVENHYLEESPAASLPTIPSGSDPQRFHTTAEIEAIVNRGDLDEKQMLDLWECLFLDPTEIGKLLRLVKKNQQQEESYLLHAIPVYTGMRRGEMLRAKWFDVDLEGGYLTAHSRKQSKRQKMTSRRIDLHPELQAILRRWRKKNPQGQFILRNPDGKSPLKKDRANRWFWQPMRGTGWCLNSRKNWFKVGFHTYRHSLASNMAARGIDARVIDEMMGHETAAMRHRYLHLSPKDRKAAIEWFSFQNGKR